MSKLIPDGLWLRRIHTFDSEVTAADPFSRYVVRDVGLVTIAVPVNADGVEDNDGESIIQSLHGDAGLLDEFYSREMTVVEVIYTADRSRCTLEDKLTQPNDDGPRYAVCGIWFHTLDDAVEEAHRVAVIEGCPITVFDHERTEDGPELKVDQFGNKHLS